MSLELIKEIWDGIKPFYNAPDAKDAAEVMVGLLVDHDYSAMEISDQFAGDSYVKEALIAYVDYDEDEDEDPEFEIDEEY